ncbi:hypothetical protein [Natrinema soli]|uniref:Uncharacterized protein n=1 Tax=Natrinema soli TaxID=1930624 RepID=A0ABD5SM83_9EURY|nr:hypothetical protein [Natrinema soli]
MVYDNGGWNAVRRAVEKEHPDGIAVSEDLTHSSFTVDPDLTAPSQVVDCYSCVIETTDAARQKLEAAATAVVHAKLDPS